MNIKKYTKTDFYKIANNLLWTWDYEVRKLFKMIDPDKWEITVNNPVKLLDEVDEEEFTKLFNNKEFLSLFNTVNQKIDDYLQNKSWYAKNFNKEDDLKIVYFSAEFGLTECIRIYSGGLGVLSGDHLKSASDLGLPIVGVGLLYSNGYFQQKLDKDGWQKEFYIIEDFNKLPIELQLDVNNKPVIVKVKIADEIISVQVWKLILGRIELYLLDTDIKPNTKKNREITETLYGGDIETRIRQEIVMGIGGVKILSALNIHPNVFHMNEGHSAFLSLERNRMLMDKNNISFIEAQKINSENNIFTTHTPVPAGIDIFSRELVEKCLSDYYLNELNLSLDEFMALGNIKNSKELNSFNMAHLAMNNSNFVNGVSKLHGIVSKDLWADRFDGIDKNEIPIGSVTNGIHIKTHTATNMQKLFKKYLDGFWEYDLSIKENWELVKNIPDDELWNLHLENKNSLINFSRESTLQQNTEKGIECTENNFENLLDNNALTIGFARRFATYKRATLIFNDLDRLDKILNNKNKPVQIIFAGKAHPKDVAGKEFIQAIYKITTDERFKNKIVFLENYNLEVAKYLVCGCDLWLNNPRRPLEASGTSGMKVVANGGLNLSILDGWWDEAYQPELGWKIGDRQNTFNSVENDETDIEDLYKVLENEIVPLYFDKDENGLPDLWIKRVKKSISELSYYFNTDRMVMEYFNKYYIKAYSNFKH